MNPLYYFVDSVVDADIFSKVSDSIGLKSIKLRIYLGDISQFDDKAVFDAFYLLSLFSGKKPFCKRLVKKIDKRHYSVSLEFFVEITCDAMYDFLSYFILCRFIFLKKTKKNVSKDCVFMVRKYLFVVSNIKFWRNLPEELKYFSWPISIEFFFFNSNNELSFYLLNALKCPTLDKRSFDSLK